MLKSRGQALSAVAQAGGGAHHLVPGGEVGALFHKGVQQRRGVDQVSAFQLTITALEYRKPSKLLKRGYSCMKSSVKMSSAGASALGRFPERQSPYLSSDP